MVNSSLVRLLLLVEFNHNIPTRKFCGMFKTSSLLDCSSPYVCSDSDWLDRSPHSFSKIVELPSNASYAVIASSKTITVHDSSSIKAISLVESIVTCISSSVCSGVTFGIQRYNSPVCVIAAGQKNGQISIFHGKSTQLLTRLISHSGPVKCIHMPFISCKE